MPPRTASSPTPRRAPGFSESYMDRSADPRRDFYRFATGRWIKNHPLPPDKSRYGSFTELYEWNLASLRKIAERCAEDGTTSKGGVGAQVGKFYRSALDTRARERAAFRPIEGLWEEAEEVRTADDVVHLIQRSHAQGVGAGFTPFSKVDDRDSEVYAFFMWQGGLSLPDRDYYSSESFAKTRAQFADHMQKLFALKGLSGREAKSRSEGVLRVESSLAKSSRPRADLRDPIKNYNRVEVDALEAKFPRISPASYLRASGVAAKYVVLGQPEFFSSLDKLLSEGSIDDWRAYLSWAALNDAAPYLHPEVEEENFDFFHRKLLGQKKPEPRWKRALGVVDRMIGEALGSLYVAEYFPETAWKRASELVQLLSEVFEGRLKTLPWMTEATRAEALEKFTRFRVKIGHPAKFRDYS
ncbi:MAG TPA: M13 family metallopeptidase N-terminal domain-containing protein, partial [Nitrososphaerales archaeon]|nr:M13 family metallopeptidase N-terminal domain-containing protein [Nitrososphaerales archaeon]